MKLQKLRVKQIVKNKLEKVRKIHDEQKILLKTRFNHLKDKHFVSPQFLHPLSVSRGK